MRRVMKIEEIIRIGDVLRSNRDTIKNSTVEEVTNNVRSMTGFDLTENNIKKILKRLDIQVKSKRNIKKIEYSSVLRDDMLLIIVPLLELMQRDLPNGVSTSAIQNLIVLKNKLCSKEDINAT